MKLRRPIEASPAQPSVSGKLVLLCGAVIALSAGCGGGPAEPPPPPPGAITVGQSIGSATIEGRVVFKGSPPKRKSINMSGDAGCRKAGGESLSEEIIVGSGEGLRNVYVRVVGGLGDRVFAPPETAARMDQRGCIFEPHILPVQINQVVTFTSSDQVMHNVRAVASENPTFNISMSGKGRTVRRFFPRPEIVRIRCDIHAWMAAYIPVSEHPFYDVTGDDGSFRIAGLPAGAYQVEAWHESLGSSSLPLTLPEGGHGRLEFSFSK